MADLGVIEQVDLREVWPHEAQDFTPWLAKNLDKLGEALGLDLPEAKAAHHGVTRLSEASWYGYFQRRIHRDESRYPDW